MKKVKPDKKYRFGELLVSRDAEGKLTYWAQWYGRHVFQEGCEYGYGSVGSPDVESLLKVVEKSLKNSEKDLIEEIWRGKNEKK